MKNLIIYIQGALILMVTCRNISNRQEAVDESAAPGMELIKICKIQAKNSSEINGSYWSIQAGTLDPGLLQLAADIGVKWTLLHCSWNNVEKIKGVYDWSETDKAFEAILRTGIIPFVTTGNERKKPLADL